MAPSNVKTKLARARELLSATLTTGGQPDEDPADASAAASTDDEAPPPELPVCPVCGGLMILVRTLEPRPRPPEGIDSS